MKAFLAGILTVVLFPYVNRLTSGNDWCEIGIIALFYWTLMGVRTHWLRLSLKGLCWCSVLLVLAV